MENRYRWSRSKFDVFESRASYTCCYTCCIVLLDYIVLFRLHTRGSHAVSLPNSLYVRADRVEVPALHCCNCLRGCIVICAHDQSSSASELLHHCVSTYLRNLWPVLGVGPIKFGSIIDGAAVDSVLATLLGAIGSISIF